MQFWNWVYNYHKIWNQIGTTIRSNDMNPYNFTCLHVPININQNKFVGYFKRFYLNFKRFRHTLFHSNFKLFNILENTWRSLVAWSFRKIRLKLSFIHQKLEDYIINLRLKSYLKDSKFNFYAVWGIIQEANFWSIQK